MSHYRATIRWSRHDEPFVQQQYSRAHTWHFDEGVTVPASASPAVVKAPFSVAAAVDPEEALVASLSSCHMLFALSFFSKAGYVVDSYEDAAEGAMGQRADGRTAMTSVTLHPVVRFAGTAPTAEEFARTHHEAHGACYIANSVNFDVDTRPEMRRS